MNKLVHLDADSETTKKFSVVPNDFYLYVGKPLINAEKLSAIEDFKPGKGPVHIDYGKKRSFNSSWLDNHNWLVYSAKDGAYCKFSVLFGTTTEHNSS